MESCSNERTKKKPKIQKSKKLFKAPKLSKYKQVTKLSGYTRAETHLGIAQFICQRLKGN